MSIGDFLRLPRISYRYPGPNENFVLVSGDHNHAAILNPTARSRTSRSSLIR